MAKGSAAQAKTEPDSGDVRHFVGNKIRELRKGSRFSDFAAKSGVHQAVIQGWEAGKPPCLSILESIAERHGIPVEDFFPDKKVPPNYARFSGD